MDKKITGNLENYNFERYDRQMIHPTFGKKEQEKLKKARVLITGIGGLGGPVAWNLAGAGVGTLILVHQGGLELPDLNRQTLMTAESVGKPRIDTALETLKAFNPQINIIGYNEKISEELLEEVMEEADLVVGARHNFPERRAVINTAVQKNIPAIEAAMNGLDGYFYCIDPGKSACMECVYEADPPWDPFEFPVFGAVSSVIGSFISLEAIKILTRFEKVNFGRMYQINFANMEFKQLKLTRNRRCKICSKTE